ncbi:hypothetical protein ACFW08_20265 [Streptomyces sp. NPDC058960]|uniref:hypothetical protein n=1 Tax=Streptomyces sp. NPDC058960 TaxID=3346679 RepID=UPI0036C7CBC5
MTVTFVQMPRADVVSYLGTSYPPQPGATVEHVAFLSDVAHGALSVQSGGQPGTTWWVVDGVIGPQDAGPLPQLDGDELETVPDPSAEPPITYAQTLAAPDDTTTPQ